MQKYFGPILSILILIVTSACHRLTPQPTLDLRQLTPAQRIEDTPITTTPAPTLDPATEQALRIYPLMVGSTWVYEYLGYDQNHEVIWHVIETVTETRFVDGYYVAMLERKADLLDGDPPPDFLNAPDTGTFWYLVDGKNLYRFEDQLFTQVSGAWLDLVLPFPEKNHAWFPNPDQRANLEADRATGFRYVSAPFKQVLPMGGTYTCYNVATRITDATAESTFCESIGFVFQELRYFDQAFGFRSELKGFSIQ